MSNLLIYVKGDMFLSPAEVIVNPVNTFGVMGKGLAAEFKAKYPDTFAIYKKNCDNKLFDVGKLMLTSEIDYRVLLFPTKKHWKAPSKVEYIEAGLKKFVATYEKKNITSIAFPPIGCGFGGLSWENQVKPLMENYLKDLPIKIYVYLHFERDEKVKPKIFKHGLDFSVDGIFKIIKSARKDFSVSFKDNFYSVTLNEKNIEFKGDKTFTVDEKFLTSTLKIIDDKNIFSVGNRLSKKVLLENLLKNFGYLADVMIYDESKNNFVAGFQLNRGAMRTFEKLSSAEKNKNENSVNKQLSLFND